MNVSKMSREKIAAALAKGGRYMNHARQWVAVKVGERVNPDDIALALVSPDALIVREAVRMASKAGRGAKKAAGAVARKVRKNPTGTGAAAVGERGDGSRRVLESVEGCRIRPGEPLAGMDPEAERLRRSIRGADARHDADRPPRSGLARVGHPSRAIPRDPRETETRKGLALGEQRGYIPRAAGVRPFLERETR